MVDVSPMVYARIRYTLKKPGEQRRSFVIMKDTITPDGKRTQAKLDDDRVDAINHMLHEKLRDAGTCEAELRALIDELYKADARRRGGATYSEENQRLYRAYWEQEYERRDISDVAAARRRLERAVRAAGAHSMVSASRDVLERACLTTTDPRTTIAAMNQLLKFAGRKFELRLPRKKRAIVNHLTLEQFEAALPRLEPKLRALFATCFATGARVGEAFALQPHHVTERAVFIEVQITRDGLARDTKNRRPRHAPIIPQLHRYVREWADISTEARAPLRNQRLSELMTRAAQRPCSVHDLRHSYAIHLLRWGTSLTLVAQALANSVAVCQEYYAGFVLAPENVEMVSQLLRARMAK